MPIKKEPSNLQNKRKYFRTINKAMEPPYLIEIQIDSYKWFIEKGLKDLMGEVSPVTSFNKELELYFVDYYLDKVKYDEETSKRKNISYEAPLRCKVKLVNKKSKRKVGKCLSNYFHGNLSPLFQIIINGVERVVVNQLIKSPGVFFILPTKKKTENISEQS